MLNVPVNNFSVKLGRSHRFLGITSTFGGLICLAQGHNKATRVGQSMFPSLTQQIIQNVNVYNVFIQYILKSKSFATLTKMLVHFFGPKQSLSNNAIDKSLYLPCIQHKNQNGVAYGCRAATIILRQPPILKSHGYNTSHHYAKNLFFLS